MTTLLMTSSSGHAYALKTYSSPTVYAGVQFFQSSAAQSSIGNNNHDVAATDDIGLGLTNPAGSSTPWYDGTITGQAPAIAADAWHQAEFYFDAATGAFEALIDGTDWTDTIAAPSNPQTSFWLGNLGGFTAAGVETYFGTIWIGTTYASHDILLEDWSTADFTNWDSNHTGAGISYTFGAAPVAPGTFVAALTSAGGGGGGGGPTGDGRVFIAFDDTPLEPAPTWTRIDDVDNLVAGYDIVTGKQTELDRTDTGTATVYLNDTTGDFDKNNATSTYFGKLVGKQIALQLHDPVTDEWVLQWRGKIRDYDYAIFPVLGADGKPIVANIQIQCVDIFDYLGGYGLQPGIDGDSPPSGSGGVIFYEDTIGTVDDRIIQILTDTGIDSTRYVVFTGNVSVQETKYDPGDAALTALRDAADAEFPGIANIYVDRFGRFVFHGRYARFDPEAVIAAGPVSSATWDFHRWKVGDGTAITGDSTYAQIRVLGYTHGESDIVNSAIAWPAGMLETGMAGQVSEDAASITAYGKHSLPPMSDLIINEGTTTGNTGKVECQKFAALFVHNLKDPQTRITSLMVKAIQPTDARAASTWAVLTKADISDIMRTTVGYPNGTGIDMDNYIEGFTKRVRPLNPGYDYVEVEYNLTPTSWSMDPDRIIASVRTKAGNAKTGLVGSGSSA